MIRMKETFLKYCSHSVVIFRNNSLFHWMTKVMSVQGWFSPGQVFVLDEYCARYGVRGCYRHLCYLSDLLDRAEKGIMIDPTLIHFSFAFCASHVHGNRCVPHLSCFAVFISIYIYLKYRGAQCRGCLTHAFRTQISSL
jgi:hypothetical protein